MKLSNLPLDLAEIIRGLAVSHIWRSDGRALFLELGALTASEKTRWDGSRMNSTGQVSIALYGEWRIETARAILCGSRSELALIASTLKGLMVGRSSASASRVGCRNSNSHLKGTFI